MNIKKNTSKIPEEVIDYCIDNKLTVAESLIQLIDKKFESVDQDLKSLKHDVTEALYGESKAVEDDVVVTNEDIAEIEDFLDNFDNNNS